MKLIIQLLLVLLLSTVANAEYAELTALKKFSHDELTGYAKRLSNADPRFEGVVNFGKALISVKGKAKINVDQLTVTNKDYWRAVLEMAPSDPSVLFAHAYLYAVHGELAYAEIYFLLGSLTMDVSFQPELAKYQQLKAKLDNRVAQDIHKGIQHHDNKEYTKALAAYESVILQYPSNDWAYYEKGISYFMMGGDDLHLKKKSEQMYSVCRQHNPFYWTAYQGSDQKVIQNLMVLGEKVHPFVSGEQRNVNGLNAFARGCEEIGLYPVAAHARWKLVLVDRENMKDHIRTFLDLLQKSGCKEAEFFRSQFNLGQ